MIKIIALRGATTILKNTEYEIENNSIELFNEILEQNKIDGKDVKSLIISCTNDITKAYPGKFIREHFNLPDLAIMHFSEMYVENSIKLCIRFLLLIDGVNNSPKFVYLKNASTLRKDLLVD
ncbi:MAG: aroH [Clostridiaceae bacterium]|jgi:chorismate mutase|nr:aroH [Clostridiaceae bacterium]